MDSSTAGYMLGAGLRQAALNFQQNSMMQNPMMQNPSMMMYNGMMNPFYMPMIPYIPMPYPVPYPVPYQQQQCCYYYY
ncbi:hypothetical protein SNEBB_005700 [Seison nebaliae]|nr:hypothetical protein SNEBB_005700 [Seison nebaliae]